MPATYENIATTTLGSAQNSVSFTSISSSFTDLVLIIAGEIGTTGSPILRFNNDSGTNYSTTQLRGNGSAAASERLSNFASAVIGGVDATYAGTGLFNIIVHIQNYSNTTTNKTALSRASNPGLQAAATVSLWRNTAAITRVDALVSSTGTWSAGTSFTLYGIKAA